MGRTLRLWQRIRSRPSRRKSTIQTFINSFQEGKFIGQSVDLEGNGANYEIAQVNGFIDGGFIRFIKQYPNFYSLDEAGNTIEDRSKQHPEVRYSGEYNLITQTFSGQWELTTEVVLVGEYWLERICTGIWEIRRDD